jgi:hypothetical protein
MKKLFFVKRLNCSNVAAAAAVAAEGSAKQVSKPPHQTECLQECY